MQVWEPGSGEASGWQLDVLRSLHKAASFIFTLTFKLVKCFYLAGDECSQPKMDPLSIGSGAAGLFSLGITICNGLIRYCSSYRSREDDIALLQANAERLRRHLEVLEGQQHGVGLPPVSPSLQISMNECLETSRTCLAGLNRLSDKYSPPSTDLNQRSRSSFVRRVSFPLQKDKFDSFRRQVQHLHTTLSFQVGMMN